jgi:NAD(P)-dependent dehydrogenase (short-subunit alcohol dehydrogenase family)
MSIDGRSAGTLALITGAGWGQGRSHALTLAAEGAAITTTTAELGPIDTLVANAEVFAATQPFWEFDLAEWQTVLDPDLTGVWLCCKHVAPLMMERGGDRSS